MFAIYLAFLVENTAPTNGRVKDEVFLEISTLDNIYSRREKLVRIVHSSGISMAKLIYLEIK